MENVIKCKFDISLFISHRLVCIDEIISSNIHIFNDDELSYIYSKLRKFNINDIDEIVNFIEKKLNVMIIFEPNTVDFSS